MKRPFNRGDLVRFIGQTAVYCITDDSKVSIGLVVLAPYEFASVADARMCVVPVAVLEPHTTADATGLALPPERVIADVPMPDRIRKISALYPRPVFSWGVSKRGAILPVFVYGVQKPEHGQGLIARNPGEDKFIVRHPLTIDRTIQQALIFCSTRIHNAETSLSWRQRR